MEGRLTKTVRADWERAVLVCRKCSKKCGGGFGPKGKTRLARALRAFVGGGKGRRARTGIVEVKCLSVCPKRGVTAVSSDDLLNWKVIAPGTPIEEVAERLGLAPSETG